MFLKVSIPSSTLCHNVTVTFCQFCIIFTLSLWLSMECFESHSFIVSIMGVIAFVVFLTLWFSQYFLYVLNETLSLLPFYHSLIQGWFVVPPPISLKFSPFLFSQQKSENLKILLPPQIKKKTQWKRLKSWNRLYMKQQKWVYKN